ncbi:MAG: 5,10-methylenetetrahydromethanopterin reductase [Thermomicrobiales bacterium]|nr:5,10-methylenetetrahydromethanopterin reductase [Thermomicrobiales bacterium]
MAALAGEVADEVKIGGSTNPAMVPVMRGYLATGEARAGRALGSVGIVMGAVTVVDEDGTAARARARRAVARYLPVVAPLDRTVELPNELLGRMAALVAVGEDEAAAALVPDEVLDRFAFSGTPAQVVRQAEMLFAAGAARIEFGTPHGFTDAGACDCSESACYRHCGSDHRAEVRLFGGHDAILFGIRRRGRQALKAPTGCRRSCVR